MKVCITNFDIPADFCVTINNGDTYCINLEYNVCSRWYSADDMRTNPPLETIAIMQYKDSLYYFFCGGWRLFQQEIQAAYIDNAIEKKLIG
jgi:hypothetical protein